MQTTTLSNYSGSEPDAETLSSLLGELRLKHWASGLNLDLAEMMPEQRSMMLRYLTKWAVTEKSERKAAIIASRIRSARFKRIQTIDRFDFAHHKATAAVEKQYMSLYNSIGTENLPSAVFTGNAGLGKTHLARALGYAACQKGISVLFLTTAEMVNHLAHAQKAFNLESELSRYRRPQVLIIDELGYVTLDAQASNLFFSK